MPSVPAERIAKGSVLQKVDDAINSKNPKGQFDKREELLARLQAIPDDENSVESYLNFLELYIPDINPPEIRYLRDFYFSTRSDSLWQHPIPSQPIEPIIRRGLVKALEEASKLKVPLDSYWQVSDRTGRDGNGNEIETPFETIIICNPHHLVTRLICTPFPTAKIGEEWTNPLKNNAPIFLVKSLTTINTRDLLSPE